MDSHHNKTDLKNKTITAFLKCSSIIEKDQLAIELRPRLRDKDTAFSGDYDYLMDPSRFEDIVQLFFRVCLEHAVSFQIRQRSAFKRQIILFGEDLQKIIFEFWPHAELTTDSHRKGWSFLTHQHFSSACKAGFKEETLALLFICHLFFRKKDLSNSQVQWRLKQFTKRIEQAINQGSHHTSFTEKTRELLLNIIQKQITLEEANHRAVSLMKENNIQIAGCAFAKRSRMLKKAQRFFKGWGARVIPCVGPDGSGKTYFITEVMKTVKENSLKASSIRFKHLFRKNKLYSYINKRYRSQHNLPKNIADEKLAFFVYWAALPSYCWNCLKSLNKKAVFMDRFFLEFMVQGYRENQTEKISSIKGYALMCRLIPEPRKMIILTADNELILSRKAEMSPVAIQDFYMRYISFCVNRKVANVLFLNTHHSGSKLANQGLDSIGIKKAK